MKKYLILIFTLTIFVRLCGEFEAEHETDNVNLSEEEILASEVANDLMEIFRNWDPERNIGILYPRVKDFISDFYSSYPDFTLDIVEKERLGEPMTEYEMRKFIAFKALRDDKIYEEVARFITTRDFYWGYISKDLHESLDAAADKIKRFVSEREDMLWENHLAEVDDYLNEMRRLDGELRAVRGITDLEVVDHLAYDEEYFEEMYEALSEYEELKKQGADEYILSRMTSENYKRIMFHIDRKKKELIENARLEYNYAREDWIEMKRLTLFDLREDMRYDLTYLTTDILAGMEEENGIGHFEIPDELIVLIHEDSPEAKEMFASQIKNRFYSSLTSTFTSYVIYDRTPVFRTFRKNVLIGTLLFMILFFYVFFQVRKNREGLFIRKIAGLDAIDDAIGRATEMGKPIVYDSGLGGYTNIDTIASMLILKSIAKKVAEFKAEIYVPTCDPIILQISEEMVASGFLDAGYPEDHKKDNIFFIAYDQFAFAAGLAGILARKKPATAFHFGYYFAESLLISEAGFSAGAIQVAGTTAVSQIPFFITACDYTLIGEELYAAAAYISRDPQILTNLKLSDYAKLVIGVLFIIGTIMLTINSEWTFLQDLIYTR